MGLAERLQNVLRLPELPSEAGQAMTTLWQLAIECADRLLQARMATDRATLATNEARLAKERTRWTATLAEAETAIAQARTRLRQTWTASSATVTPCGKIWCRTATHLRAVEDRAHQEIDRVRQETKQWQHRHEAAKRSYREAVQTQEACSEALQKQWQNAEKEVARLSGHIAALETSLAKASARPKAKRGSRSARSSKTAKAK